MAKTKDTPLETDPTKFLTKEAREDLIQRLEIHKVKTDGLGDAELLKELQSVLDTMHTELTRKATNKLKGNLNSYTESSQHFLTDKIFLARLFKLNVPSRYLRVFRDEDSVLPDNDIWLKIRQSGIKPFDDVREVFATRYKETVNVNRPQIAPNYS